MPETLRQQIVDAIEQRMKMIRQINGYETDIGENIFWWLESPLTIEDLPGMICRDRVNKRSAGLGIYDNTMQVEIEAKNEGSMGSEDVRNIIADIERVVALDETWGGLAFGTEIVEDEIMVEQNEYTIAAVKLTLTIEYRTVRFDPYTQA